MHSVMDDPIIHESSLPYPKTLDKSVLTARAQEMQKEVSENAVDENGIDAASGFMDLTGRRKAGGNSVASPAGAMEAAAVYQCHFAGHDATSKPGGSAKPQFAQEEGTITLTNLHGKGQVIEDPHEGCDDNSPLWIDEEAKGKAEGAKKRRRCATGEIDGVANGKTRGEKKRKNRSKNWTNEETEVLKVVALKTNVKSRFDKHNGSKRSWGHMAENVPGRTG